MRGLVNSDKLLRNLACKRVNQTTPSFIGTSGIIPLIVYVDDIVIIESDSKGISSLKSFLQSQFHTKDLGMVRYFLGIEVM